MRQRITRKWWTAYRELMGKPVIASNKPKTRKPKAEATGCRTEDYEQIVLATWLDKNHVPFFHVPNGGARNLSEGAKFKRMGVKAGVPDIFIPIAKKSFHGLFLELKRREGGRLTDNQKLWRDILQKNGYCWLMAKGSDEGIKIVTEYLDDEG